MYPHELRMIRVIYGMNQKQFSELLECTASYYSSLENGIKPLQDCFVKKIADRILKTDRFKKNLQLLQETVKITKGYTK